MKPKQFPDVEPLQLTPEGLIKMKLFIGDTPLDQVQSKLTQCRYLTWFAHNQARLAIEGRRIRILKDWHDQPIGRSKPNLKGKEFTVYGVILDGDGGSIALRLDGLSCAIPLGHVELL